MLTLGDTEEWDSGIKSWSDGSRPKGFAIQVLSELETDIHKHRRYWSTFGKGEQVKLFCKIQLMKDHSCPKENGGNCIIYALQLQPRRHKQNNLHKTRQRRLQQSQQL